MECLFGEDSLNVAQPPIRCILASGNARDRGLRAVFDARFPTALLVRARELVFCKGATGRRARAGSEMSPMPRFGASGSGEMHGIGG